jgi:hypothetical protein
MALLTNRKATGAMENNEQATTNPQGAEPQGKESPVGQAAQELMDELGGLANRLSNLGRRRWRTAFTR